MKQITVKRAVEAWYWLHNNDHHEVGLEFKTGKNGADVTDILAVFFRNHHEKMRVPEKLRVEVMAGLRPNKRKFDTRMYALTRTARERVS